MRHKHTGIICGVSFKIYLVDQRDIGVKLRSKFAKIIKQTNRQITAINFFEFSKVGQNGERVAQGRQCEIYYDGLTFKVERVHENFFPV